MSTAIYVVSFILATIIVRVLRSLFMSIFGINAMFVSFKAQLLFIAIGTAIISTGIASLLGITL